MTLTAVADALITDQSGRILLVQPIYRPDWVLPGGELEHAESPEQACTREVHEEIGLQLYTRRLLLIDWLVSHQHRPSPLMYFLFDCGQLDQGVSIRLAPGEIRNYAFIEGHHLGRYLTVQNHARLHAALRARTANALIYMPDLLRNPP